MEKNYIETIDELRHNIREFEMLRYGDESSRKEWSTNLTRGASFLPYKLNGRVGFISVRYLGTNRYYWWKKWNGGLARNAVNAVLKEEPKHSSKTEKLFINFCNSNGITINPDKKKKPDFYKLYEFNNEELSGNQGDTSVQPDKEFENEGIKTEYLCEVAMRDGQDKLRKRLLEMYKERCMLQPNLPIGVDLLVASHIKPWKDCEGKNEKQRMDINNVLLLSKASDALFDKGYISFDDEGNILFSSLLPKGKRIFGLSEQLKLPQEIIKPRLKYMRWHRAHIFKK